MSQAIENRIKALEEKLKQAKVKKQMIEARAKAIESKAKRAKDTRRKVLIGAFVLEQIEDSNISIPTLAISGKKFTDWLVRDSDRAIFDLPSIKAEKKESTQSSQNPSA